MIVMISVEKGKVYQFTMEDFIVPTGGVIPGETKVRRVLEPASVQNSTLGGEVPPQHVVDEWNMNFYRVQNPHTGKVHLLAKRLVRNAVPVDDH